MAPVAILDIDGTLVDTNYHHAIAWYRAFRQHGLVLPLWRIHRHIGMGGDQLVAALAGDGIEERARRRRPRRREGAVPGADRRGRSRSTAPASCSSTSRRAATTSCWPPRPRRTRSTTTSTSSTPATSPTAGRPPPTSSAPSPSPTWCSAALEKAGGGPKTRSWSATRPGTVEAAEQAGVPTDRGAHGRLLRAGAARRRGSRRARVR